MTPGDGSTAADKRAARAERAAEAKVREEREKDPVLMAAYQEKNRKEEEEQKPIVAKLDSLFEKRDQLQSMLEDTSYQNLKSSILAAAFRGQLT